MRPLKLFAGLLLVGLSVPLWSAEVKEGPIAAGKNVPGSFHPFNVNAREKSPEELDEADREAGGSGKDKGKFAEQPYSSVGKFHCLVTEYDLDPVVLLFAKDLNDSEGFKELLTQLDAACTKYRLRRLRAFVVFRAPADVDITKDDEKRKEMADAARKIVDDLKLKNVVLSVDSDADVKKYELTAANLTAVLYRALRIRGSYTFSADELDKKDAPAVGALMKDVERHLLPK
jgi:hypothetical protein